MRTDVSDGKKLFKKLGTCSRTFFYIINREFDNPKEAEERASDPLAGGIFKQGYQCGMLWGASLAVGAEAYRRSDNRDQAIGVAINISFMLAVVSCRFFIDDVKSAVALSVAFI